MNTFYSVCLVIPVWKHAGVFHLLFIYVKIWSNCKCSTVCFCFGWANIHDKHSLFPALFNNRRGSTLLYAAPVLVVYSRNPIALWSNQFEINKIWQSSQPKKAQTLEKMLVVSPEGTLIPSVLLPAHFMPCSALIDVKIVLQIREYQCVCLCVCLFACSAHLLICVCVFFIILF